VRRPAPPPTYALALTAAAQTVLALSRQNTNAAQVVLFLHRLVQVLVEYFKELEEESIRDNFVVIYELMDEMMDFGHPQTTESKILQECVARTQGARGADGAQVHHAGVAQARGAGAPAHGGHERGLVALRGHPVPQKRGLP
jgi:hypothetical protein